MNNSNRKILVITGSFPPDICGVGDYTYHLLNSESAQDWSLYKPENWSILSTGSRIKEIRKQNPGIIFLQFPTLGYGWSIVPHLICLYFSVFTKITFVVVFHELSQLSRKAGLASFLLLLSANKLIFTSEFELNYAAGLFSRTRKISRVIRLASNIRPPAGIKQIENRNWDIVNFGLFRPARGIEEFIEIIKEIRINNPALKIALLGQVPKGKELYFAGISKVCDEISISIFRNLEESEIAGILNDSKIALLPFPDGVSERRGTFLAALVNGAVVVTTKGMHTTRSLEEITVIADAGNAARKVLNLLNEDTEHLQHRQKAGFSYLENEIPASWNDIAKQYLSFVN